MRYENVGRSQQGDLPAGCEGVLCHPLNFSINLKLFLKNKDISMFKDFFFKVLSTSKVGLELTTQRSRVI